MTALPHTACNGLKAREAADVDDETLLRFYTMLLEPYFPPDQLISFKELRRQLQSHHQSPATRVDHERWWKWETRTSTTTLDGTILFDDDTPVAGILTEGFLGGRVLLVTHLVVASTARRAGIGTRLLKKAVRGRTPAPLVLAEIEDPRYFAVNRTGDPAARLRFYERAGSRLLPLPYVQPSLKPGSPRVGGLLLISIDTTKSDLEGTLVAEFLEAYYSLCEGKKVVNEDPMYLSLHAAALGDERGRLPLLPLTALRTVRADPPGDLMKKDRIVMSVTLELEVGDKQNERDVIDALETILPYMAEHVRIQRNP